jgi:glycosyltransferase involved in cell wall biosynthesis
VASAEDRGERPQVLIFADYFSPGFRAGGPVKSIGGIVAALKDSYEIRIVTRIHDWRDSTPYEDVVPGRWTKVGDSSVMYVEPGMRGVRAIGRVLRSGSYELVFLQSLFSGVFTVWPLALRWLRGFPPVPILLAPRGELSPGALGLKAAKKRIYLLLARLVGLYRGVTWQASAEEEAHHIKSVFGSGATVRVCHNVGLLPDRGPREARTSGPLRILFLSRIAPKKNLDFVIRVLARCERRVRLLIVGPIGDEWYFKKCERLASEAPPSVEIVWRGAVRTHETGDYYRSNDVLFLPTRGENFGWVIPEALSAGCPVLISDQTPWRGLLGANVGWDLPLSAEAAFVDAIRALCDMSPQDHTAMTACCRRWIAKELGVDDAMRRQVAIVRNAIAGSRPPVAESVGSGGDRVGRRHGASGRVEDGRT